MNHADLLVKQRKQAKFGMSVALGSLVASSLLFSGDATRSTGTRTLHVCAGVALVACAYWHWSLYGKARGGRGA